MPVTKRTKSTDFRQLIWNLERAKIAHRKTGNILEIGRSGWDAWAIEERQKALNVCGKEGISIQLAID